MKIKSSSFPFIVAVVLAASLPLVAQAHSGHVGSAPEAPMPDAYFESIFADVRNVYTEPGSNEYQSTINELSNEYIDTFAGLLQLKYADIVVPANGGLDIAIQRNYLGIQPHQFRTMTAIQRSVNGLGWQVHFGRLTTSTFSNASLCEASFPNPNFELQTVVNAMLADLQPGASRTAQALQERIQTVRSLLSQRVRFSNQQIAEMQRTATLGAHDIAEALVAIIDTTDAEAFDLTTQVPGDDTTTTDLVRFFIDLVEPLSLSYNTRDSIAFEMPDGSRHSFFRDDRSNDGSLMTLGRLKLRCESSEMVVLMPNGTKYFMTEYENFIGQRQVSEHSDWLTWGEHSWYVSRIEDVHGNTISLSYGENAKGIKYLTGVNSSDTNALSVSLIYENEDTDLIRLESIEAGSKKWNYTYQAVTLAGIASTEPEITFNVLDTVVRPDGRVINYDYDANTFQLTKMTDAYGMVVDYTYQDINILPAQESVADSLKLYSAIQSKTISGPDVETASWSFDFAPSGVVNNESVERGSPRTFDVTTVNEPYASSRYFHYSGGITERSNRIFNWAGINQSLNLAVDKVDKFPQNPDSPAARIVSSRTFNTTNVLVSTQAYSNGIALSDYYAIAIDGTPGATPRGINLPVISSQFVDNTIDEQMLEGGVPFSFATVYNRFDTWGFPQGMSELETGFTNSGATDRVHAISYSHNTESWILGLATRDDVSDSKSNISISSNYNDLGLVEKVTRAGVVTEFTYHPNGELASIKDANGHITNLTDYANGVARSVTNAENETTTTVVNATGTIASVTDPRKNTTTYTYDNLDRVTSVKPAIGATTTIEYPSDIFQVKTTRGGFTSLESFDVRGRQLTSDTMSIATTDSEADRIVTTRRYDLINRPIFVSNPSTSANPDPLLGTTIEYDGINRRIKQTDPAGEVSTFRYSLAFDEVATTNRRGFESKQRYTRYGFSSLLSTLIEPISDTEERVTKMSHNLTGQVTSIFQGGDKGLERTFEYDSRFFLSRKIEPETGITFLTNDAVGNVIASTIESNGRQTTYNYDDVNRLTSIDYPEGTDDISYTYLDNGLLESATTGSIRNDYSYDANNNLTEERLAIGGRFARNYVLGYEYDELDNRNIITYPNGLAVDYNPNALGRPQQVGAYASAVKFAPQGQVSSLTMANGKTLSYDFDERLLPSSIVTPDISNLSYQYDPIGNVSSITNGANPSQNVTFGADAYDGIDRLQNVVTDARSVGAVSHKYNPLGDIQQVAVGSADTQQIINYDNNGVILRAITNNSVAKPNTTLEYDSYGHVVNKRQSFKDQNGVVTSLNNRQFVYDDASRLQTVEFSEAAGQNMVERRNYSYDAHKQRVVNEVPGTFDVNYSFYSLAGDLMFEESIDTCKEFSNIRLGTMLLARNTKTSFEASLDGDSDSINDCLEHVAGLDPTLGDDAQQDLDGDGISNADEILVHATHISNADSDGDGMTDSEEVAAGSNPNRTDSDGDGISDTQEFLTGLSPVESDSDRDGIEDLSEQIALLDPLNPADGILDLDSDGFSNRQEDLLGFNSASSASTPPDFGLKQWVFDGLGVVMTSPAMGPDRSLYYATDLGHVYAVYPNGKLKWTYQAAAAIYGSVVVDPNQNTLYFASADGMLNALDLDGNVKWQTDTSASIVASPAIDPQSNVYLAAGNTLLAYDSEGQQRWSTELPGSVGLRSHLAISLRGVIYVGDDSPTLNAIDSSNGEFIWTRTMEADVSQSSPAIYPNGDVLIARADGFMQRLRPGSTRWTIQFVTNAQDLNLSLAPVIGSDDVAYIGNASELNNQMGYRLLAFDGSGRLQWNYSQLSGVPSTPTIGADGTVYIADFSGRLHAINSDGTKQWSNAQYSSRVFGSPVQDADGTLYLASNDGFLHAYADNNAGSAVGWSGLGNGGFNSSHQCQSADIFYSNVDDLDSDGFPDCYEWLNGLQIADPADGQLDSDGDGLSDGQEFQAGTRPDRADSDGDGISDGEEIANGNNPLDFQPRLRITNPSGPSETFSGRSISFSAFASDAEDDNNQLTRTIGWRSQLDGVIGTGGSIETSTLSIGQHIISAVVTDSGGSTEITSVALTIIQNLPPVVEIVEPGTNITSDLGQPITFTGTASDPEEGNISMTLKWSSSQDGALGMGASIGDNLLSIGQHIITAQSTDAGNLSASATVEVFIDYDPDADADNDGLTNQEEVDLGTNPIARDTDHDLLDDFTEVTLDTNPLQDNGEAFADYDNDGFSNRQENATGSDLLDPASVPALGSQMWLQESSLHGGGIALSDDGVIHSKGTTFYPDGRVKRAPEQELTESPTLGKSGAAYYRSECALYKMGLTGNTFRFSSYLYEADRGFCIFGNPSVNANESLIVVGTGAAYEDAPYLGFLSSGALAARYLEESSYDFSTYNVIGSDNGVYSIPDESFSITKYDKSGPQLWQAGAGQFTNLILDFDNSAYLARNGSLIRVDTNGNQLWSYPLSAERFEGNISVLVDENRQVYTLARRPGSRTSDPLALHKIDAETGLGEALACDAFTLDFIGKNGLIYTTTRVDLNGDGSRSTVLQACDSSGTVIWQSASDVVSRFSGSSSTASSYVVEKDGTVIYSNNGQMAAYVTDSRGLANSPWPRARHDNRLSNHQPGAIIPDAAQILTPQKGRRISSDTITLNWTDTAAENYRLSIGSQAGETNYLDVVIPAGTTSYDVTSIPRNGMPVYVTLESQFVSGVKSTDTAIYQTDSVTVSPTAEILSPVSGTVFNTAAPVFTWNDVGAERYRFWVGSTLGGRDIKIAFSGAMTTSKTLKGLPLDGSELFIRFATLRDGVWTFNDYQYTAHTDTGPQVAELISPLGGTTFASPNIEFTWNDANAQRYRLWFGTTPGAKDIKVAWANGQKLSKKVNDLPLDGSTIYLRFATRKYEQWQYVDYEFTAHTDLSPQVAELISPAPDSTWASPHIEFEWQDIGADRYRLFFGSAPGLNDIKRVWANTDTTSKLVRSLPHDGSPIYVRMGSKKYGRWKYIDYVYTTHTDPIADTAELVSHANGDTLAGDTVTFSWDDIQADRYRLIVGTTKNGKEISAKTLKNPALTTYTVTGLPTDGSTLFVKLSTFKYGVWTRRFYEFNAASATEPTTGSN